MIPAQTCTAKCSLPKLIRSDNMVDKFRMIILLMTCQLCFAQQDSVLVDPPPVMGKDVEEIYPISPEGEKSVELLQEGIEYSDNLNVRSFEENFQQKYQSEEFDYTLTKPRESLWSKIKRRLAEFISRFLHTSDAQSLNDITLWVMRILAVVIVGLVLYWLLRFLMNKDGNWFFGKKDKEILPEARTITENIHQLNFQDLISRYETEKSYRYAVRYQYLHLLKLLTDKGLIEWDEDKTNLDYIHEIKNPQIKDSFRQLTLIFDYVWYGEFDVNEESYTRHKEQFNRLKSTI